MGVDMVGACIRRYDAEEPLIDCSCRSLQDANAGGEASKDAGGYAQGRQLLQKTATRADKAIPRIFSQHNLALGLSRTRQHINIWRALHHEALLLDHVGR